MSDYVVESKKEAIKILRSALEEVVLVEGNFKYAVAEGIIAIEKQIPEKPTKNTLLSVPYRCYNCNFGLLDLGHRNKYCPECGKKIDWED